MSIYQELAQIEAHGGSAALCTVTLSQGSTPRRVGSKMLVYPDGKISGTIGGGEMENRVIDAALEVMTERKARTLKYELINPDDGDPGLCGGHMEVFVEPIQSKATLVIVGAGHVGKATAHLADWLGFRVLVSDDRPEFCTAEQVPEAQGYFPVLLSELPKQLEINAETYLILTTRSSDIDVEGLPALLDTKAAFIGVIGSKRRWEITRKKLKDLGVAKKKLDQVVSPIGMEINAESPEEIAVSILSEIIMMRQGGDGKRMTTRK